MNKNATVKVCVFERPKNGLIAEADVSKPHIVVDHDDAVVEMSSALAFRLVLDGRAEVVEDEDPELEDYEPDEKADVKPPVALTSAIVEKNESSDPAATRTPLEALMSMVTSKSDDESESEESDDEDESEESDDEDETEESDDDEK